VPASKELHSFGWMRISAAGVNYLGVDDVSDDVAS
jgi:hypothetical protein